MRREKIVLLNKYYSLISVETDHKELEEFVKSVLIAVDNSKTREFRLKSNVEFELSILTKKEASGKMSILIADVGGIYEKEAVSKIKFSMGYEKNGTLIKV